MTPDDPSAGALGGVGALSGGVTAVLVAQGAVWWSLVLLAGLGAVVGRLGVVGTLRALWWLDNRPRRPDAADQLDGIKRDNLRRAQGPETWGSE